MKRLEPACLNQASMLADSLAAAVFRQIALRVFTTSPSVQMNIALPLSDVASRNVKNIFSIKYTNMFTLLESKQYCF